MKTKNTESERLRFIISIIESAIKMTSSRSAWKSGHNIVDSCVEMLRKRLPHDSFSEDDVRRPRGLLP